MFFLCGNVKFRAGIPYGSALFIIKINAGEITDKNYIKRIEEIKNI